MNIINTGKSVFTDTRPGPDVLPDLPEGQTKQKIVYYYSPFWHNLEKG